MGRIDTSDELREYLDEFDILLPLTAEEAEKVLEYIKNSGYTLETDGYGQLYRTDLENGECLETDIDHMIDDACESNYEMISDIRDYFVFCGGKERDNLFQVLQGLLSDEKILNTAFSRTYFQKELQVRLHGVLPAVEITAGRRVIR